CARNISSSGVGSGSTDRALRSSGPQWSHCEACITNCLALDSGQIPAATSYQSTSSSLGQSDPLGLLGCAACGFTSCRYSSSFLLHGSHDSKWRAASRTASTERSGPLSGREGTNVSSSWLSRCLSDGRLTF